MTLLVEATLKISVLLAIALAATLAMRRASAALRHWVLAAAIACAAVLPVVAVGAPGWTLARHAVAGAAVPPGPSVEVSVDLPAGGVDVAPVAHVAAPLRITTAVLFATWLLGLIAALTGLLAGCVRLSAIARRATPVRDERWTRLLATTAGELGVVRPVRLLESSGRASLVTWGLRRPVLLVPPDARTWSDERIRVVLRHELAHVRRGDWPIHMLAAIVRAWYWFDPLVWIACARLRQESEHACDDVVLNGGVRGHEYASHLVDLARNARRGTSLLPAQAIVGPSQLRRRVRAMLHTDRNRQPLTRTGRLAPIVALLLVTSAVAGYGRAAQSGTVFSGTVTDPMGRGMSGATVSLVDVRSRAAHQVVTDAAGAFQFVPLPAADYKLLVKRIGFQTTADTVTLSGPSVTRAITMQIGNVEESIRVTETPTLAKPSSTTPEQRREKARSSRANDPCAASSEGGCLMPPAKLVDVRPVFPPSLKGTSIADPVILRATIGTDGAVKDLAVVSSPYPELSAAAMDAVRQWEFAPTQLGGVPIDTTMRVTVKFEK